jgi:hypothetical protein
MQHAPTETWKMPDMGMATAYSVQMNSNQTTDIIQIYGNSISFIYRLVHATGVHGNSVLAKRGMLAAGENAAARTAAPCRAASMEAWCPPQNTPTTCPIIHQDPVVLSNFTACSA